MGWSKKFAFLEIFSIQTLRCICSALVACRFLRSLHLPEGPNVIWSFSVSRTGRKMRAPIVSCVLEFGHIENTINDKFEIWKPGTIFCAVNPALLMILDKHSWNWRPHQIGSLFVYHKASVFQPFSASLIYHWCMHRDLILEYETWRRDESHEFGRGAASGLPGWFPVQGHSRLSRFQFADWFYKLKENLRVFPELKSELLHIETLMDYSCFKFILLGTRCGSSPVPIPFHFVNLCQCEIFYRGRSSAVEACSFPFLSVLRWSLKWGLDFCCPERISTPGDPSIRREEVCHASLDFNFDVIGRSWHMGSIHWCKSDIVWFDMSSPPLQDASQASPNTRIWLNSLRFYVWSSNFLLTDTALLPRWSISL